MMNLAVIGNLGADAELKETNGRKFVTFRVAHTSRSAAGVEVTNWVSCAWNGDGGGTLAYLKRGTKVYVSGRPRLRVYSSPKTHQMEAGIDLSVDFVELCGQREPMNAASVTEWLNGNPDAANEIINALPF